MTFTITKIRGALKDLPGDELCRDEWALALGDPTELDDEAASADVHCAGVVHADRPVVVAPERLSPAPARGQQAGHLRLHVPLPKILLNGDWSSTMFSTLFTVFLGTQLSKIKIQLDQIAQEAVHKQSTYLFHVEVLHGLDASRAESQVGQEESLGRRRCHEEV